MKNILSIFVGIVIAAAVNAQTTQPNIILVLFDDMNNMVEGYGGHPQTITPNLVELQGKGTTFTNAFCSSPLCAPSRASMMLGKSLEYTDIFLNNPYDCADFRNNFSPGKYVLTLPEHLKESAGYFTYSVGKVFHCDNDFTDYDTITADPCAKNLSWNKYSSIPIDDAVNNAGQANPQGIEEMKWSAIDSSLVSSMTDYSVVDSASNFLNAYATDPSAFCNMPFFMAVGIRKPHSNLYIPEQYFSDFYIDDFYTIPWEYNYNLPINSFPENGIVMPTLTTPEYTDYDALSFMSQKAISIGPHKEFRDWPGTLSPMPIVNDTLTSIERAEILTRAQKANAVMAYLAAIRFADDQVGRLMDSLEAHPEIYDNTVIIITSDHGFALGEKKHWGKGTLHETDIRIPFIIADLRTLSPPKVCNRTVSHLDVFPTINAYAGGPQPTFPGGASYLDGYDLAPLMNNPNLQWERGAITQVKNAIEGFVCFPQNSVRTDRFHFIRWETNNAEGLVGCDDAANNYEYELYELGMNRDVDPEEWYNLAFDSNYAPVIEYLVEQLPGGSLHLQKTLKTTISLTGSVCLYDNDDVIKLRSKLFNV
ncbi:MAG: sulfatase-like hydrolase/transferase, partial [Chitinophagales bacterium]